MINIRKANQSAIEFLNLPVEFIEIYELVEDNTVIGYGVINQDIRNMVTIYILEEYRGNGYGKVLFEMILEKIKELGYKEIYLTFDKNNIMMKKIIVAKRGLEISIDSDKVTYVIPVLLINR